MKKRTRAIEVKTERCLEFGESLRFPSDICSVTFGLIKKDDNLLEEGIGQSLVRFEQIPL